MEERRVKRFQIGDSISPSSFVPVKRKSRKDPCNQAPILSRFNRMDADRRNNFINNKSNVVVVVAPNATIDNNGGGSSNNHASTANGTISSSTESSDSVEPPKQPFSVSNKDFNEKTNACNEQCNSETDCDGVAKQQRSDSNPSINGRDSDVVCSVLNKNVANNVPLYDSCGVNLNSNSNETPSSPALSRAVQPTNYDEKRSTGQQYNADKDSHACVDENQTEEHSTNGNIDNKQECSSEFNDVCKKSHTTHDDGITISNIERLDNRSDNGQRINSSSNDIDASRKSNAIETVANTIATNQLLDGEETDDCTKIPNCTTGTQSTATLNVQNSSEDCISSTDTISSNSIDVKPIKCPANQSQAASESDQNGCPINETKETSTNIDANKQTVKRSTVMFNDDTLKRPLLGKQSNGKYTTVYSAIDRPNVPRSKGNNDNENEKQHKNDNDHDDHENVTADKCDSKRVAYNDYVNLLCDTDKGGIFMKNSKRNAGEEGRPLLRQSISYDEPDVNTKNQRKTNVRPRSIVKSPSTQNFSSSSSEKFDVNRKPRLSIQCSGNDPERPVLHVQFLQHNNDSSEGLKGNLFYPNSPTSGDHMSYQNGVPTYDSSEKQPIDLINQMPARGILRQSRMRDSISSSSSGSSSSSDSSSSDDVSQFAEAKPPDGGWGWVVVFASFMVNMIADGITFSFGVIYVRLLEYFGEGKAKTAWIGSLFMAMPLLSGPVASFLTDRYGCRKVTIIGSILASIGFFLSAFTDSVEMLCLTFGIFAGFGLSLCYVAAVVIVAYYFDKRRSFATGLSVCGSGIGTFIFAPFTQMIIDEYGWRGTTLILSGVFLNMTVCGMLMRDLEWTTYKSKQKAKLRRKRNKLGISADSFSVSNSTNTGGTISNLHKDDANGNDIDKNDENSGDNNLANQTENVDDPHLFSSLIALPTFVKNGEKVPVEVLELMSSNKHVHNVLLKNYPGLAHSRSFSQPLTSSRHSNGSNSQPFENSLSPSSPNDTSGMTKTKNRRIKNEQAFLSWLKEDQSIHHSKDHRNPTAYLKDLRMHRHSLTYRGAMLNINRYRLRASSCPDIYRNSMTTIAKEKTQWGQGLDEFKSVLMDMLDFSFFIDIRFTLFALSNFMLYAWYDVPYMYLADFAKELGLNKKDGSSLISYIGIINMLGEIMLGWFGDRKFITAGMIYAICMVFCGLVTGLVPLLSSYTGLSILSGLFGLFIAANYALTSIILVELISLERFTNAYGLLLLVQGIANLIGPPLAGWITDLTGNYILSFYLSGSFIAVSGVIMMLLPMRGRIRKYRKFRRRLQSNGDEEDDDDDDEETDVDIEKCETAKAPKSLTFNGLNGTIDKCSSNVNQVNLQ